MSTSISFAMMGHHDRSASVSQLGARLKDQGVVLSSWVSWAEEPGDVWGTAKRAWAGGPANQCSWHVVLQDDAILADDFVLSAQKILTALDEKQHDAVVSFFSFADTTLATTAPKGNHFGAARKRVRDELRKPFFLELTGNTLYAVGLAIPTKLVPSMVRWTDEHEEFGEDHLGWGKAPKTRHDDKRILDWAKKTRVPCLVACPNIVDHSDGPSIANPKSRTRVSRNFLKSGASELDWASAVKNPIKVSR